MASTIRSLDKALELIDELAIKGEEVGVTELSRRLGMNKSQVYRILSTFVERGYVHKTAKRTYRLGTRFIEIGQKLIDRNELVVVAPSLMDELRDATGESIQLYVKDGLGAMCILRRESQALLRLSAQVGQRAAMHAGACPKAILAFQPSEFVNEVVQSAGLPAFTEHTITDRRTLEERLAQIREQGFAESIGEVDRDAYSIAVPIADKNGQVSAAMSVAGPAQRFDKHKREQALLLLLEVRDELETVLGVHAEREIVPDVV